MSFNRLSLNSSKTRLIWFGTTQQLQKLDMPLLSHTIPHFTFLSSSMAWVPLLITPLPSQIISPTSHVPSISIWDVLGLSESLSPSLFSPLSSTHLSVLVLIIVTLYLLAFLKFDYLLSRLSSVPPLDSLLIFPVSHISSFMTQQLHWLPFTTGIQFKVIFLDLKSRFGSDHIWHPLSLLSLSAISTLPNAMIFSCLVLGQPWPTLGFFLLLVHHSGITSLLIFARLFSLLPFSCLSLTLSFTFFLELKCTESTSWLTSWDALYLYTIQIQLDNTFVSSFSWQLAICSHHWQLHGKTDSQNWLVPNNIYQKTYLGIPFHNNVGA